MTTRLNERQTAWTRSRAYADSTTDPIHITAYTRSRAAHAPSSHGPATHGAKHPAEDISRRDLIAEREAAEAHTLAEAQALALMDPVD